MKKLSLTLALFSMVLAPLARGQTTQLQTSFSANATGNYATGAIDPQIDTLNVRCNGLGTSASWTCQIQTSPDNATWTNCGTLVTATAASSASGGACAVAGASFRRVSVAAGAGGGSLTGVLFGNATLVAHGAGGGAVSSVFGRAGAVAAASGDYTAAQVTNAAALNAPNTFTASVNSFTGSFGVGTSAPLVVAGVSSLTLGGTDYAQMFWRNTLAPVNETVWRAIVRHDAGHGEWELELLNDALATEQPVIDILRNLNTVTSIALNGAVSAPSVSIGGDTAISAGPRAFLPFATGQLAAIVSSGQYFVGKLAKAGTIESFTVTGSTFTCATNPTLTLEDCGTIAGTCAAPVALASATLTAANTSVDGTITSATLTAGHYFVVETTAGVCTALNATGSAEYRMN